MTPPDDTQRTIGGLAGKAVGKAKEALGHAANEGAAADAEQAHEHEQADGSIRAAEDARVRAVQEANRPEREAH